MTIDFEVKGKEIKACFYFSSCVHWCSFVKSFLSKTENTQPSQIIPKLKVRG